MGARHKFDGCVRFQPIVESAINQFMCVLKNSILHHYISTNVWVSNNP